VSVISQQYAGLFCISINWKRTLGIFYDILVILLGNPTYWNTYPETP